MSGEVKLADEALVERVARVIAYEFDIDADVFIGMHGRAKWEKQWHPIARAAIEATRPPVVTGQDEEAFATSEVVLAEMRRINAVCHPSYATSDREDLITYAKEIVRLRTAVAAPGQESPNDCG